MLTKRPEFGFHASERHEGFGEFTLFDCKGLIGARTGDGVFAGVGFTLASEYERHLY